MGGSSACKCRAYRRSERKPKVITRRACPKTTGNRPQCLDAGLSGATPGERLDCSRTPRDCPCATAQKKSRFTRLVGTPRRILMSSPTKRRRLVKHRFVPSPWPVPALGTAAALADWLGLTPRELDWFADVRSRSASAPAGPLRHYLYQWQRKRSGTLRLLEVPKPRLKQLQRQLLHELVDLIPPHAAAHGFRRGHSLRSYVEPHVGQRIVLRFDLCDFFASVRASRVHALFGVRATR